VIIYDHNLVRLNHDDEEEEEVKNDKVKENRRRHQSIPTRHYYTYKQGRYL